MCKNTGNYEVLQRAKYNVEAYYTLVGMANDLKRSFELLEVLLPAFFKGNSGSEGLKQIIWHVLVVIFFKPLGRLGILSK